MNAQDFRGLCVWCEENPAKLWGHVSVEYLPLLTEGPGWDELIKTLPPSEVIDAGVCDDCFDDVGVCVYCQCVHLRKYGHGGYCSATCGEADDWAAII